jgi:TetR/AcrR family transcriptional repressor of bet genes
LGQHKTWNERRDQLIQATIASIHEFGLEKTSLQRVANRAGLTAGVVAHYFGDKDGLIIATYEALYEEILANANRALTANPKTSLAAQLRSVLLAYLTPDQLTPDIITAWYTLVARLRHSPALREIQAHSELVIHQSLKSILQQRFSAEDAGILASGLYAMMTGFWIRMASEPSSIDLEPSRKELLVIAERLLQAYSTAQLDH